MTKPNAYAPGFEVIGYGVYFRILKYLFGCMRLQRLNSVGTSSSVDGCQRVLLDIR